MSVSGPLLPLSWRSLAAATFPVMLPSVVFLRPLINQASKHSGTSFRTILWPEPRSALLQAGSGTAREITGSWSISMGPNRQHDSGHFPRQKTFLPLTVVLIRYARKAISHANEDKWGEHGRRFCNRTRINGWAPFLVQEMVTTEKNCDKPSKPSRSTRRRFRFLSLTSSCASMDCMETRLL